MEIITITKENFDSEVLQSQTPVLVDFWASWCGPCKMLSPIIDEIAQTVSNVKFCKINVDEQEELAKDYNISAIPTLLFFKDGLVADKSVGFKNKDDLLSFIK